jgi:tRNA A37 threonylcarbamoyladenosine synthetase subunit TsaC/SUA5/YrdC
MSNDAFEKDAADVYGALRTGGLVLLPTDVGYGLVAMEEEAVAQIYELKGRPLTKPCVTVVNDTIFDDVALAIDPDLRKWLRAIGARAPIAVVAQLDPSSRLLASMSTRVREQATQSGTIAAFFSAGRLVERVAELALADGRLVVGSSANLAGTGNNYAYEHVPESMRRGAALAFDRGTACYASDRKLATTILDLRTGTFLRQGIDFSAIEESWREHLRAAAS